VFASLGAAGFVPESKLLGRETSSTCLTPSVSVYNSIYIGTFLRVKLEGPTLAKLLLLALHLRGALSEATACALFSVTIRNWMKMLLAVLLGNLAYFLLAPHLPNVFAHDMFQVDAGLLLDLGICAALYLAIRKVV